MTLLLDEAIDTDSGKGRCPLEGYRALDLTDEKGYLCGKILGDLGVDVIKVEKPGGDPGRRLGPFYHDQPHPEKSLYWFAFNNNKRSITLNLEAADGRAIFKKLAEKADFVIESFPPGYMERLGVGYDALRRSNPRLVYIAITPFGQKGPYAQHKDSDITLMAVSGFLYLIGDTDRPPVQIGFPQSYLCGGLEAAAGALMAHYYREMSGEGQLVDVSVQASLIPMSGGIFIWWDIDKENLHRRGPYLGWTSTRLGRGQRVIFECADGYFTFVLYGGKVGEHSNRELVKWMAEDGLATDSMKQRDWASLDMARIGQEELDDLAGHFERFFRRHTKAELYQGMLRRGIMGYPVADVQDLVRDRQLRQRGFWVEVEHPELGRAFTYPGAFAKFSESGYGIRRRAPLIGEHNVEIYEHELGFTRQELVILKQAGAI